MSHKENEQDVFKKPANPLDLLQKGDLSSSYSAVGTISKIASQIKTSKVLPEIKLLKITSVPLVSESNSSLRGHMFDFRLSKGKPLAPVAMLDQSVEKRQTTLEPILEN